MNCCSILRVSPCAPSEEIQKEERERCSGPLPFPKTMYNTGVSPPPCEGFGRFPLAGRLSATRFIARRLLSAQAFLRELPSYSFLDSSITESRKEEECAYKAYYSIFV
jgi:hypothetical protein